MNEKTVPKGTVFFSFWHGELSVQEKGIAAFLQNYYKFIIK